MQSNRAGCSCPYPLKQKNSKGNSTLNIRLSICLIIVSRLFNSEYEDVESSGGISEPPVMIVGGIEIFEISVFRIVISYDYGMRAFVHET